MSKFDYKKVMPRYTVISILMTLIAFAVVGKTLYLQTAKRDYWMKVAARVKKDSVEVKPNRGNILSCNGELMASTLPEYKIFMDFVALKESKNDSLWFDKIDSICIGLNQLFPERSVKEFKKYLQEGFANNKRHWPIVNSRIDYNTYTEVRKLPIFRMPFNYEKAEQGVIIRASFKSGFCIEENSARQRSYGDLAGRTIGAMFGAKDSARFGLELSYDSILRGQNGIIHRRKIRDKFLNIIDTPPVDGADIITTIDVNMQDLAERAVIDELKEINGNVGVAIVMEVQTGDIKAIVNMEKCSDGQYRERKNHAVSDLLEPGSVFKTASILVALDDGVVDTCKRVDTYGGVYNMYGRSMKDHNWHKGGYGTLTLPQTLHFSSNIGVSRIIDEYYHNRPEKFVEGIYRTGLADDLKIPLVGSSPAKIRMPRKDSRGKQWVNWSNTALPWMSIGYETQVPPISTLTFYNAIANDGKMMRPRFVKQVVKDGKVIMDFPPEVIREHIAKPNTIKTMQTILEQVVSIGLGKKAGSPSFKVAGKTGTAQIWTSGGKTSSYLLSFAGFFPADNPRYSCIVCIQKTGLPASGGGMSGVVFHHISEGIIAQDLKMRASAARDSFSVFVPDVKPGNLLAADYVISHLKINQDWHKEACSPKAYARTLMPNVIGMGARDAVYYIESRGVKVNIKGRGKVVSQSIPAGTRIKKGQICELIMEI